MIKSIPNPLESQIVNSKIAISDYIRDNNNVGIPINVRSDVSNIVQDIINNNIQANNDNNQNLKKFNQKQNRK